MDRRRNRRGRGSNRCLPQCLPHTFAPPPQNHKSWSFFGGLCDFFIMASLVALIYMMLDYHCTNCSNKCDMGSITKSIDGIAKNLSLIKDSYYDMELKIARFSQDLPKLEGQIEILEALANTMEKSQLGWDPKTQLYLPHVDDSLNKPLQKNCSNCSVCTPKPVGVKLD